ncbi:hypothetical protein ACFYNO_27995 [Kitasatospora sp. NPDC006697]|uniref:hypothetical protein n=1 Tax=Kitasatospora sp. NPDC006697 TaxID=3364020 RepID=UPI003695A9CA
MSSSEDGSRHGPGRTGAAHRTGPPAVPVPWLCRWQAAIRVNRSRRITRTADGATGYRHCGYHPRRSGRGE